MHIHYSVNHGWSWYDTIYENAAVKKLEDALGDAGIYYALAFFHPQSAHFLKTYTDEEREAAVLGEIKRIAEKRSDIKFPKRTDRPNARYYQHEAVKAAIPALLAFSLMIDFQRLANLRQEEEILNRTVMENLNWASKPPAEQEKMLNNYSKARTARGQVQNEIRIEELHINSLMKRAGRLTLVTMLDNS